MNDADRWSEYWQDEGASGEVFVDAEGRRSPVLDEYWARVFESMGSVDSIVDLACGGGSVFSHIGKAGSPFMVGADVSIEALKLFGERYPTASTVVASAASLPFKDRSFDVCVSQFGIEYAGIDAFSEAARIVLPGGQLIALVHIRDGYIDGRNAIGLEGAQLCEESDFVSHAIAVTNAVFDDDRAAFDKAADAFAPAERALAEKHDAHPQGVHAHLYAGFRQLFEQHKQYAREDIVGWLDAMRGEVRKSVERLSTMREAAQDENDIAVIATALTDQGLTVEPAELLHISDAQPPVAWILKAARPA